MYRLILFLIFCSSFWETQAQSGVQFSLVRPTGDFAKITNNTGFGLDYIYRAMDEGRLVAGVSLGAYRFTTTQDTFFTKERNNDRSNGPDSVTVWESFRGNQFFIVPLTFMADYKLGFGDFSPFVGAEVIVSTAAYVRDFETQAYTPQTEYGDVNLAVAPRVGFYYIINDEWAMSAGLSRNFTAQLYRAEGHYKAFINIFSWF